MPGEPVVVTPATAENMPARALLSQSDAVDEDDPADPSQDDSPSHSDGGAGRAKHLPDQEGGGNDKISPDRTEKFCSEVLSLLRDIQGRLTKIEANQQPRDRKRATCRDEEARDLYYRSCRSLSALETATDMELRQSPANNALFCEVCVPKFNPADHVREGLKVTGVFKYDFSLGTTFGLNNSPFGKEKLPSAFKSLRVAVKNHFQGAHHAKNKKKRAEKEAQTESQTAVSKMTAMRVLRTGYYVLKRSLPHAAFEELVALQHVNGARMGTINHSAGLMPKLRVEFCDVMRTMLSRHLVAQPCLSVCADKVTVERRTIDIVAVTTIVPEAAPENLIQSFVVAAPVVTDHSGEALGREIARCLSEVGVTHPDQLAATCFDGQYHKNKVPETMLRNMAAADPQTARSPSVVSLWDGSHLLNLADADARSKPGCEWVNQTKETVTRITKRHVSGKGLEVLLEAAEKVGSVALRPKLWSDTRFAPYAARTFCVFRRNQEAMAQALRDRVKSGEADSLERKDLKLLEGKSVDYEKTTLPSPAIPVGLSFRLYSMYLNI